MTMIPMDENSVPEENVAQNSGNVNLVEGHNRSSGEVGESFCKCITINL